MPQRPVADVADEVQRPNGTIATGQNLMRLLVSKPEYVAYLQALSRLGVWSYTRPCTDCDDEDCFETFCTNCDLEDVEIVDGTDLCITCAARQLDTTHAATVKRVLEGFDAVWSFPPVGTTYKVWIEIERCAADTLSVEPLVCEAVCVGEYQRLDDAQRRRDSLASLVESAEA